MKIRKKRLRRRYSRMSLKFLSLVVIPFFGLPGPNTLTCLIANSRNVFFDLDIAGEKAGRIVFKLYDDIVPKVRPLPPSLGIS